MVTLPNVPPKSKAHLWSTCNSQLFGPAQSSLTTPSFFSHSELGWHFGFALESGCWAASGCQWVQVTVSESILIQVTEPNSAHSDCLWALTIVGTQLRLIGRLATVTVAGKLSLASGLLRMWHPESRHRVSASARQRWALQGRAQPSLWQWPCAWSVTVTVTPSGKWVPYDILGEGDSCPQGSGSLTPPPRADSLTFKNRRSKTRYAGLGQTCSSRKDALWSIRPAASSARASPVRCGGWGSRLWRWT